MSDNYIESSEDLVIIAGKLCMRRSFALGGRARTPGAAYTSARGPQGRGREIDILEFRLPTGPSANDGHNFP